MMDGRRVSIVSVVALLMVLPLGAGFEELAQSGQWRQLLQIANRRSDQLPLRLDEAYLAAYAARQLNDPVAEETFLARAAEGGPFEELARVELARLVVPEDGERAVRLVLPMMRRTSIWTIREEAVAVAVRALRGELGADSRMTLEHAKGALPRSQRRKLELALAASDGAAERHRLGRLLASTTRDLVALDAARMLQSSDGLSVEERWRVAETLYRHAFYSEAEPLLESLFRVDDRALPRWRVAFLRGRCAFRQGRWDEAAEWYQRAISRVRGAEQRAELEVHLARTRELGGRMDGAVEAAKSAVRSRTTDERRLFLARLRLRLDQPDFAWAGISRVKGRSARARGELMVALHDIRHQEFARARRRLEGVRRRPWVGPATVLAADIAVRQGDAAVARELLDRGASDLDPFWAEKARDLIADMAVEDVARWRLRYVAQLAAHDDRASRRALARWCRLEPDRRHLATLQTRVARRFGVADPVAQPTFADGLAGRLWRLGLSPEALRWDPAGMPTQDVAASFWSALQHLELGTPSRAIRAADAAWRMAGSDIPMRAFPDGLRRAFHPLPDPDLVWRVAVASGVPWSLLAGVAREESRWEPRAVSRVGARGLMQLMPGTAAEVAARAGQAPPNLESLFEPEVSLELGAAELGRLLEVFGEQWAPAVAAYNAGEAQARLWLDQCGSPCPDELYVANITFTATRIYTGEVLAAAPIYVELYGAAPGASAARPMAHRSDTTR